MCDPTVHTAVDAVDLRVIGLAEPRSAVSDGVEHRLHVGRRAGDDTQDLAGRGLLLERLGQRLLQARALRPLALE